MRLEDKINRMVSLLFALVLMGFGLYLVLTTKWLVYVLATFNIITFGLLFVLTFRELIETWRKDAE
jgi:hypothetical protein